MKEPLLLHDTQSLFNTRYMFSVPVRATVSVHTNTPPLQQCQDKSQALTAICIFDVDGSITLPSGKWRTRSSSLSNRQGRNMLLRLIRYLMTWIQLIKMLDHCQVKHSCSFNDPPLTEWAAVKKESGTCTLCSVLHTAAVNLSSSADENCGN